MWKHLPYFDVKIRSKILKNCYSKLVRHRRIPFIREGSSCILICHVILFPGGDLDVGRKRCGGSAPYLGVYSCASCANEQSRIYRFIVFLCGFCTAIKINKQAPCTLTLVFLNLFPKQASEVNAPRPVQTVDE